MRNYYENAIRPVRRGFADFAQRADTFSAAVREGDPGAFMKRPQPVAVFDSSAHAPLPQRVTRGELVDALVNDELNTEVANERIDRANPKDLKAVKAALQRVMDAGYHPGVESPLFGSDGEVY